MKPLAALACVLALAGCEADDGRRAWRELTAAEESVGNDDAAFGAAPDRPQVDMGGDLPSEPAGGIRSGDWHSWARRAWPAACAKLKTIERTGTIAREGRTCRVEQVMGIVPTASVVATGILSAGGERLPVGWAWTAMDLKNACATDPVGTGRQDYRLTRSRSEQRWRATPLPVTLAVDDDPAQETCADLERFLARR